jgi:hypothetical protein
MTSNWRSPENEMTAPGQTSAANMGIELNFAFTTNALSEYPPHWPLQSPDRGAIRAGSYGDRSDRRAQHSSGQAIRFRAADLAFVESANRPNQRRAEPVSFICLNFSSNTS